MNQPAFSPSQDHEILEAFKSGKVKRAKDATKTQKRHQQYAEAMFKKDARINIRLTSKDLRAAVVRRVGNLLPTFWY